MSEHTPGPWRWEFNEKHRQLTLVGGRPKYDLTIMEFCRWGMWGAGVSMRDTRPDAEGFNLMHKVHERPDWIVPFPGRAHHKDWCAAVAHPDMRLMQAAPDLLEALEFCKGALEWAIEQGGGPACEHEVGVCFCREIEALHSAIAAIAKARSRA